MMVLATICTKPFDCNDMRYRIHWSNVPVVGHLLLCTLSAPGSAAGAPPHHPFMFVRDSREKVVKGWCSSSVGNRSKERCTDTFDDNKCLPLENRTVESDNFICCR